MDSEEDLNAPLDLCLHGGSLDGEVIVWTNQKPAPIIICFEWFSEGKPNKKAIYDKIDSWDAHTDEDGTEQNAGCYYMEISEEEYNRQKASTSPDAP